MFAGSLHHHRTVSVGCSFVDFDSVIVGLALDFPVVLELYSVLAGPCSLVFGWTFLVFFFGTSMDFSFTSVFYWMFIGFLSDLHGILYPILSRLSMDPGSRCTFIVFPLFIGMSLHSAVHSFFVGFSLHVGAVACRRMSIGLSFECV